MVAGAVVIAESERLPVTVRPWTERDMPLVMDSWLRSAAEVRKRNEGVFCNWWQTSDQREILARPTTRVLVACPEDDPDTIHGWAAIGDTRPWCLYYVFVRHASRQLGIARLLLAEVLRAEHVFYGDRPAMIRDARGGLTPHPVVAKIPHTWRFVPRINHRQVDTRRS